MNPRKPIRAWLGSACAVLLLSAAPALAQTGSVSGVVTDVSTGEPLNSARVQVVGTNLGVMTDQDGRYLLPGVPVGTHEVRAGLIGYSQQTETVTVSANEMIVQDFEIDVSAISLETVVVNAATGREERVRELGSNVAAIDLDEVNPAPVTSMADALGGRSDGVIMQDVNGTTGTSQRIRIRGANSLSLSNEPLVFVDGVQINTSTDGFNVGGQETSRLNDINPADIANVEIVKGPAASALYGTAAANGVLLITTKRGRAGETRWSAYMETGRIEDVTDYPDNILTYEVRDGSAPRFGDNGLFTRDTTAYKRCPNLAAAAGECSQDETMRFNTLEDPQTSPYSTGMRRRYGASVRGGTETVRYFVSGKLEDEVGVVDFNTLESGNFRANVDAQLSPDANLAVSFGYARMDLALNNNDNSIFSPIINGLLGRAYYVPSTDDSSDEVNTLNYGFGFNMTDLGHLPANQNVDRYTTSVNFKWRPTSWLSLNATGGLDLTALHEFETLQPDKLPIAESYTNGYRHSQRSRNYVYSSTVSAVATREVMDDLVSTTTVGGSFFRDHSRNTYCFGSSLVPGTSSCGTTAALFSIDEDFFDIRTVGAYVQQQFGWRDRVFVRGGLRGDDNSAFGANFGFVYYPSASVSWVVAEESWFPDYDWLSGLRVRSAVGTSGLRPEFRDAVTLFAPTTVASATGDVAGVTMDRTGNTTLEPERTTEWEAGFDLGLLDDRVGVVFTYFNKTSRQALIEKPLPPSLGLTEAVFENLGSIQNAGTELTTNFQVLDRDEVGLSVGFTNTTLSNEILALGDGVEPIPINRGLQRHEEGYPAGGFFQQEVTWDDANNDGLLSIGEVAVGDSAVYVGPSLPTWQRSLSANLRVFDWINVSTLLEGRGGHYTGNDSEAFRCGVFDHRGCAAVADPEASLEAQAAYIADRHLGSAYGYIEPADFWRWRELSLALTTPDALADRVSQLRNLRLTVAGRNLALFTDYSGLDPETVEAGGSANFHQSEFNTQPPVRYIMVRLDYTF